MKTIKTDVAIIGGGSAGLNARREAEKASKSWVMIEGGELGTTCARVGCMPSKLLIAAANAAHEVRRAPDFGVQVDQDAWHVDGPAVMARVRRERDRFVGFVVEDIEALDSSRVLRGQARFVDTTTLQVDALQTRVEADAVVIATGSTPFIPEVFEAIREHILLNDDVFELEEIPEKLAVVGAGVIGLEIGQAMARLGAQVHVLNHDQSVSFFTDEVVTEAAAEIFSAEVTLTRSITLTEAKRLEDGRIELVWEGKEGHEDRAGRDRFTHVLVAAGRRPNTADLGLEQLDIPRDERGHIKVPLKSLQLGDLPIFMAGDVANHRPLLHEATDEGHIAGSNAASYPDVSDVFRRTPIGVAFTEPQMAFVGKRFGDLDPETTAVGQVSYANQGRARVMLVNQGVVRLYADREDCRLVGGELLGPDMEHMAHLMAWVIQMRMRVPDILRLPFYHPVIEEGIRTCLRDLAKDLRVTSRCASQDFPLSPGH